MVVFGAVLESGAPLSAAQGGEPYPASRCVLRDEGQSVQLPWHVLRWARGGVACGVREGWNPELGQGRTPLSRACCKEHPTVFLNGVLNIPNEACR